LNQGLLTYKSAWTAKDDRPFTNPVLWIVKMLTDKTTLEKSAPRMPGESMHTKLSLHHIGGRAGGRGFPYLEAFESDLISVLYDADPECIDQIQQRNQSLKSENYVFPFCFGGTSGKVEFHVNLDPYTSSILQTNPEYQAFYAVENEIDYCWGESS